jgi:REP element-mobilizing transposase RayT
LHRYARDLLKQPPVHLDQTQRQIAGRALVQWFAEHHVEILALSLDAIHYHLLARFRDKQVRPKVGCAKKHAYHVLRDRGFMGKLWQRGCNVVPITDRQHQLNVFAYISRHKQQGAWVWTFREGLSWLSSNNQ